MAVRPNQRALLELILLRDHGYGDIAGVLDISRTEARDRAHEALEALAGTELHDRPQLCDHLLMQLGPAARADVERDLEEDEETRELAVRVATELRRLIPGAELPPLPGVPETTEPEPEPEPHEPAAEEAAPEEAEPEEAAPEEAEPEEAEPEEAEPEEAEAEAEPEDQPRVRTRPRRRPTADRPTGVRLPPAPGGWDARRIATVSAVLLVLVAIAIALVTVLGDDGEQAGADATGTAAAPTATETPPRPVTIELSPTRNAPTGAAGRAAIGATDQGAGLGYELTGLEPTRGTRRYVVWLYNSRKVALPVTEGLEVGADGALSGVATLRPELVEALTQIRYVDVSLEPSRPKDGSLDYHGRSILRGAIAPPAGG